MSFLAVEPQNKTKRKHDHPAWKEVEPLENEHGEIDPLVSGKPFKCRYCLEKKEYASVTNITKHLKYCKEAQKEDAYEKLLTAIQEWEKANGSKPKKLKKVKPVIDSSIEPYDQESLEYQCRILNLAVSMAGPSDSINRYLDPTTRNMMNTLDPKFVVIFDLLKAYLHTEKGPLLL